MGTQGLRSEAGALLESANADPAAVLEGGPGLARRALDAGDDESFAVAGRAVGLAAARLSRMPEAVDWLERAHAAASASGDRMLEATVAMTYAAVLSWVGDDRAIPLMDLAVDRLHGPDGARALAQRGEMRYRRGRFAEALADLDAAEAQLAGYGEVIWRAHALTNRGLARVYVGSLDDAEADLLSARDLYTKVGAGSYVATVTNNLGWASAEQGDIPRALAYFDEAESHLARLKMPLGQTIRDRSEALIAAHLTAEAFEAAQRAAADIRASGHEAAYAEALATLGRASLRDGRPGNAVAAGAELAAQADSLQMHGWGAYGRYLELEGRYALDGAVEAASVAAAVEELTEAGLVAPGSNARLLAAEVSLGDGHVAEARAWLDSTAALSASLPLDVKVRQRLVRARISAAEGRRPAAFRAALAGVRLIDEHQATLGATEARAAVAGHAAELGQVGMGLAAATGRPRTLFDWMERTRAGSLRFPPARPPEEPDFAAALARLRRIEAMLRSGSESAEIAALHRERSHLEDEVRRRSRHSRSRAQPMARATPAEVLDRLGDAALVMYAGIGGEVHAVVLESGRARHVHLEPVDRVRRSVRTLRASIGRLARRGRGPASERAALAGAASDIGDLENLLLAPLRLDSGRPLVVVPPSGLYTVPWAVLPSMRGRPITVAPSASVWMRPAVRRRARRVLLANGPRLAHGASETRALARVYDGAVRLTASAATADRVIGEIGRAEVVHLVAHGHLRRDNPQFSALELIDGPLRVYDLEALSRAPSVIVLSACDAGVSSEFAGNEIMGFVASLLALGTRSVVAGVGLVPDELAMGRIMADLHRGLERGAGAARALSDAYAALDPADPRDLVAGGLVAFGS